MIPEPQSDITVPAAVCAKVRGEPFTDLPQDLYIPPGALEVVLEAFEGPLDLLLYLIRKQNLDILDIPIREITNQYIEYIDMLKGLKLELAAEYLVMAALLAEIKSRLLLPRPKELEVVEEDPRAELVRRLQLYEQFKQAAESLDDLPRMGRELFVARSRAPQWTRERQMPKVTLKDLIFALNDVLKRQELFASHAVQREPLSVRERMTAVLTRLTPETAVAFGELFTEDEGRMGIVVTFLAVLELLKESLIELEQTEPFAPIYVKAIPA